MKYVGKSSVLQSVRSWEVLGLLLFGSGIFSHGPALILTNSTVSGNSAGILNNGSATLKNTIVANSPKRRTVAREGLR